MKKLFTGFFGLCVFGLFPVLSQTTFTDNFDADQDYLTAGVTGTGWDGIMKNEGFTTTAGTITAEINALNTTDSADVLTFTTTNSYWAGDNDNGTMLYKEILSNTDFEMQVKIVGGLASHGKATVAYMMPGLMARVVGGGTWVTDSTGFIAVQAFDQYSVGMQVRSATGVGNRGVEENWTAVDDNFDDITSALYPYLKLARVGNVFTGSVSKDGETWFSLGDFERADMAGINLKIGIINCTYTENIGGATFDDFKATAQFVKAQSSVSENLSENLKVYYNRSATEIMLESESNAINSVNLISIDGKTVKTIDNFNGSSFDVAGISNGLYIVAAKLANGVTSSQKVIIY